MRDLRAKSPALLAALLLASACSGGGDSSGSSTLTSPSTTPANAVTITITRQNGAQSFTPNPATAGGQTVVFRNSDVIVHRVALNDGAVDTGDIAPGATSHAVQMPAAGTNYHCAIHPDMIGAVSGSAGAPPPACTGIYCGDY